MIEQKKYNKNSKAIALNKEDNIIIALDNMRAGETLNNFELTIDAPILAGQKIAKVDIEKNDPILKYGTIIGFADSNIIKGQVLNNNNVVFKTKMTKFSACYAICCQ